MTTPGVEGGLTLLDARGVLHLASGPTLAEAKVTSSERIGIVGRPLGYAYDAAGRLVIQRPRRRTVALRPPRRR